jgi:hypothetical protein
MRGPVFHLPKATCSVFVLALTARERGMTGIDREAIFVLAFGWFVALAVTLS